MDVYSRIRELRTELTAHMESDINDVVSLVQLLSDKIDLLTDVVMDSNISTQVVNNVIVQGDGSPIEDDGLITLDEDDAPAYIPDVDIGKSKGRVKDNKPVIISSDMKNSLNSMDNIGK